MLAAGCISERSEPSKRRAARDGGASFLEPLHDGAHGYTPRPQSANHISSIHFQITPLQEDKPKPQTPRAGGAARGAARARFFFNFKYRSNRDGYA
jgi:hypothetical protein